MRWDSRTRPRLWRRSFAPIEAVCSHAPARQICKPSGISLTDKGVQRLEYLAGTRRHAARPTSTPNSRSGEPDMRTKRLYSGLYHCPECVYEVTLTSEPSLKCPDCGGRLYEGELPEESEDDDDYDEGDE